MRQSAPYNLLATRRWMLLVPRSRDCFDSVPVNALGFAGSLFVRDEAQMQAAKARRADGCSARRRPYRMTGAAASRPWRHARSRFLLEPRGLRGKLDGDVSKR